jgi:hypothetical protein
MFRTQRASVSVIGALVLGPLSLASLSQVASLSLVSQSAALVGSALVLAGCQDESQPEYWVEKLDDKAWRPRAIKRLEQFFEDAVTKANKNMDAPEVKALVDKIAVPLTQTYVTSYSDLDENVRVSLIKLIAAMRDPRTEPALTKALDEFGKRGLGGEDIKWAARAAADMKLESVADEVLARLKRRMGTLRVGDPLDKNTDVGAINSAEQLARIRELSDIGEAEGAERWSAPCELPSHGYWFAPTIFTDVTQAHRIAREEIFGPVLSVLTFRTPSEAVAKANNTPYGLSAGVWTDKGSRILQIANQLRAGVVWANTFNKFDPASPFGGYKESGYGREGGKHGLEAYLSPHGVSR